MAANPAQEKVSRVLSAGFLASVSLAAAVGFLLYGGRLFLMLQRFPIESRGRKKKLREVGMVTAICAACFTIRCGRGRRRERGGSRFAPTCLCASHLSPLFNTSTFHPPTHPTGPSSSRSPPSTTRTSTSTWRRTRCST
jgi:hypothetical protein